MASGAGVVVVGGGGASGRVRAVGEGDATGGQELWSAEIGRAHV